MQQVRRTIGAIRRGLIGWHHNRRDQVPNIGETVDRQVIGRSVDDREIICYQIGQGPESVIFYSGIHGNEVGTVKLAHHLIEWLDTHKDQLKGLTFYVIPCLNPDGYATARQQPDYWRGGRIGRFNAHGIDLNRNFKTPSFQSHTHWSHGRNYQEVTEVFAGDRPQSEPETQALVELVQKSQPVAVVAFHSAGADVMGNAVPLSQQLTQRFSGASGYRVCDQAEWKDLAQTGTAKEWTELQNIAYLEVEAKTRWGSDWENQREGLEAVLQYLDKKVGAK